MGVLLNSLVAVTSLLTAQLPDRLTPPSFETPIEAVSYVMFDLEFTTFTRERFRLKRAYPHLDWTTDGCSAPVVGGQGRSFNFTQACVRHDFGYRNTKKLGHFTESTRAAINSFCEISNHRALGKCEPAKFVAFCGQKRFMLRCGQQVVSELRPFFQHCNIDELMKHLARYAPHCFII